MYRWTVARILRSVYGRTFAGQDSLMMRATAPDVTFNFPGTSSFAASLTDRESVRGWLARFTALSPRFDIRDVAVSGPPWNMTAAVRFRDAIGADYENEGVEWLRIRWGRVRSLDVFLDTERVSSWERRHLGAAGAPSERARASLAVAEAVEETAEYAAFAGEGRAGRGRDRVLASDGLVIIGAGDGVDDLGLVEVLGVFDLRHVADEHAVAHDLGFEAGRAVGVPLRFAAAGQRHPDAELVGAAEQVSVDATVTKGVDHPAGSEFVHARTLAFVPETSLNTCWKAP
jgi:ketosteroid isomerase-like protein